MNVKEPASEEKMKGRLQDGLKEKLNTLRARMDAHPLRILAEAALITWIIVEALNLRSLDKLFFALFHSPLVCLYNYGLILATLCPSLFFKRRKYVFMLLSSIWILLSLSNFILLFMRTTPLTVVDFSLIPSVLPIVPKYLTVWQIILVIVCFIALFVIFIITGIRARKTPVCWKPTILFSLISIGFAVGTTFLFTATGILGTRFSNLADGFQQYGFVYCFGTSIFDRGVDRPDDYSDDRLIEISSSLEEEAGDSGTVSKANIIMVQLESFFDVNYLKDLSYSKNPIPNFCYLKDNYSRGFLSVPSIGAGTANTEFEILTGMSLDYFGTGEYPYKTVLLDNTCESICYNLKEYGYSCHALHNNEGTFYNRDQVFANLGFDTYTSIEYMEDVEYNVQDWAKDKVLTGEILDILESTPGRDFVFGISVQAHGRYLAGLESDEPPISVSGIEDPDTASAFAYYLSELHATDRFVGELVNALSKRQEKTVLVLYGDHLPSFDIQNEDLSAGNVLTTEYVIWSNYSMPRESRDLEAYQLSANILGRMDYDAGVLTKLHQLCSDEKDYQTNLEMLEYDMLYGDKAVFEGGKGYEPTKVFMGTREILLEDAEYKNHQLYVYGAGFTPFSQVYIDGDGMDTVFVDSKMLIVCIDEPKEGETIEVSQVTAGKVVLSCTKPYEYQ